MTDPTVSIRLDGNGRVYRPGDSLSGQYLIESLSPASVKAIELSVLWYSEGKGDEDLAVHDFRRRSADNGQPLDLAWPEPFSVTLPQSPLSYDGLILKLRWCVRVRVLLQRGKDLVAQKEFRLGDVPAAKAPPP
jgi:hypothetical protein